jgi:hypothetical protein
MSASQDHGFIFERWLNDEIDRRLADVRPPAIAVGYTARFDVPAWKDPEGLGVPTSIKMAKRQGEKVRVDLADARRNVLMTEVGRFRLMVGVYHQKGDLKIVHEVHEFLLTGDAWNEAIGEVPMTQIEAFHAALKKDGHVEARARAKEWKQKIAHHYPGLLRWAPKIDSKNQRRLQCFVYLADLVAFAKGNEDCDHRVYRSDDPEAQKIWKTGPSLPFQVTSPPRVRHTKTGEAPVENTV